ncbi:MAG: CAP domain-containing protein [Albidovulum sp.]
MSRRLLNHVLAGAVALALLPTAAAACPRASVNGADAAIRPESRLDQALADAAIRAEVNYQRCRAGLPALTEAEGRRIVAARHAIWMARTRTLSHTSAMPGQSTTLARIKASGLTFRAASENIGRIARFQIDDRSFRIAASARCSFLDGSGRAIPPHTYSSLARTIVARWMASQAHRRNVLDRRVTRVGSGIGFDSAGPYCGSYYVSLGFAG